MTSRLIKALGIIVALLLPGKVLILRADDNGRTLISREGILAALHSSGIPAVPEQMEELSKITAAEANPPLKVTSIDVMDGESDKVLLRCEHANTCLPFYVLVHWGHAGTGSIGSWG